MNIDKKVYILKICFNEKGQIEKTVNDVKTFDSFMKFFNYENDSKKYELIENNRCTKKPYMIKKESIYYFPYFEDEPISEEIKVKVLDKALRKYNAKR